jgi:serine/threonine protein phosphatase PrpC
LRKQRCCILWIAPPRFMLFEFFSATDTGRARSNNEDAVAVDATFGLVVLADGMGGYNAGEVASDMVTSFIKSDLGNWLRDAGTASDTDVRQAIETSVEHANRAVYEAARANAAYAGMGTTLVVGVLRGSRLLLGHVGDSRAYRWRDGRLLQITRDHSLLQEQIDAGIITPEQAQSASNKNLVTRAVGVDPMVQLETHEHQIMPGDVLLLCSDGLSDMIDDAVIARVLERHAALDAAGAALIEEANGAGGKDNIAVILVRPRSDAAALRSWWHFGR